MVPALCAPEGFADAAKSTAPLPFTLDQDGMVSHGESDEGCQLHPAEPCTLNLPVLVVPATLADVGNKVKVQLPPDWVTVNICPLTVMVAVRIAAPGLTATP